jgi:hypothetical protein
VPRRRNLDREHERRSLADDYADPFGFGVDLDALADDYAAPDDGLVIPGARIDDHEEGADR